MKTNAQLAAMVEDLKEVHRQWDDLQNKIDAANKLMEELRQEEHKLQEKRLGRELHYAMAERNLKAFVVDGTIVQLVGSRAVLAEGFKDLKDIDEPQQN